MAGNVGGEVSAQVADILEEYENELKEDVDAVFKQTSKETAKMVSDASPYNPNGKNPKGHYKSGWKVKKTNERDINSYTVYQANKPQLTHLLENGWVMRNGKRHEGDPHISKGEEWAESVIVSRIEAKL